MMTQTQSITAAAEVWRVDLEMGGVFLHEGVYTNTDPLKKAGEGATLPSGVGLAGSVLARKLPVLLNGLDESAFERCPEARESGVCAALGLPVFDKGELTSVAVLMFRGDPGMVGSAELWTGRSGRFELCLTQAYYAGLDRFGAVSRHVNFPKGSGLPGIVWQSALPRLGTHLGSSVDFLRSTGAESAGLVTGFGYPVISGNELKAVLLLLSSKATPLASVHEIWHASGNDDARMIKTASEYRPGGEEPAPESGQVSPIVRRCVSTRGPVVFGNASELGLPGSAGPIQGGLALPLLARGHVRAVGVLAW